MPKTDVLDRLESARTALESDAPRALKLLPPPRALPAFLRAERDFLEAEALRSMGFLVKAEALYAQALKATRPKEDPVLFAEASLSSASALRSLGRTAEARARLKIAAPKAYARRLRLERAMVDRAEGLHESSLRVLRPMLAQAIACGDWAESGFLFWAIGGAERLMGRLGESASCFQRSLGLFRRARDASGAGYALFGLAGVSRIKGELEASARHYRAAGKSFASTDDVFAKAYALCGHANALRQLGRLGEAESSYRKSEKLYSSLGDEVDLAYVVWGRGKIRLHSGKLLEAEALLKKALGMFSRGGETRGVLLSRLALAQTLYAQGKTGEGERLHAQAVRGAVRAGLHTHLEVFT
jgi:tetratricopeptide (TPR) repeat protein